MSTEPTAADGGAPSPPPLAYADASTPRPDHLPAMAGITRGDVASLGLKLLAIFFLVQGAEAALVFIEIAVTAPSVGTGGVRFYYVIVVSVQLGIGLFLLLRGDRVGVWLLPKNDPVLAPSVGSPVELQAAALAVVGVVFAMVAVPELASFLWRYSQESAQSIRPDRTAASLITGIIKPGVQLVLGLWLFAGSKALAIRWQRTRTSAIRPSSDEGPL